MSARSDGKPYAIEFYAEGGRKPVLDWIKGELDSEQRRELGTALSEILQEQGSGVCDSEFGKWVDADLFYFRLRTQAGAVFRLYCHEYAGEVVLLLHGYDKGKRPSRKWESDQIAVSRARLKRWSTARVLSKKEAAKAEADARSRDAAGPLHVGRRR